MSPAKAGWCGSLSHQLPDSRGHLVAEEFDAGHESLVRKPLHPVLQIETTGIELPECGDHLPRHRLRRADVEGSPWTDVVHEVLEGRGRKPRCRAIARTAFS